MIKKLFDIKKDRYLLVNLNQIQTALTVLKECGYIKATVCNCGWAKAPLCYFMRVSVTDKQFEDICRKMNKYGVKLLDDKTVGY